MSTIPPDVSNEILNSWKEIACYLDRGVRTVQRWEVDLHLPVRRLRSHGRSPVMALRSEIDLWLKATKQNGNGLDRLDALKAESLELRLTSQQLQRNMRRARVQLALTIAALVESMERIAAGHQSKNGLIAGVLTNYPAPPRGRRQAATA